MVPILTEFKLKRICLGQKAFGFLQDLSLDKASIMESTKKILDVLNEVGGSCQSSGVWSLIEMFTVSGSFDIAEFVIGAAGRKVNHYNILIREFCRRKDSESAWKLLKEMKQNGCEPNITSYNMVISCLCTNEKIAEAIQIFQAMEKDYGLSDASTCGIFIHFLCKHGQLVLASEFLDKMIMKGIEPCIATNAAIIKAYFRSEKYEEAHKFVVDSVTKQRYSSNENYSLLASLHLKKGNLVLALKILHEMMDKGLKPNFRVYMAVSNRLEKFNRKEMHSELTSRYSGFIKK
ncbi:pentatricopeptide repeat-containing protein [Senna tora]|uniref:Pentatricopeptide repeat-containing protein n=1 Tax=Senna tora TaxID=362788 RepID=A0A834WGI0_9FABA|nr:pentatricopeptide repeat-containing protein [Senna tora]